ncbi:redox-sensitive transcriptional regulator (at-rich dna-binding protein) [hydrocarbon metagenome]|uniref:Redox-sensitive transcriptional regulator (At-rich dna-binding protein) n=1 Tax=hydrocarbon metagenome TaxID=938273 RepID=A0A0W8FYJ1_9ZZZZ
MRITPEPTMRRLPHYLHFLRRQLDNGVEKISSTIIADALSLDSTQVRKDLEYTGVKGKPKTGFFVKELINAILEFLTWTTRRDAFVVGTGNLGSAMLGYKRFRDYGLHFVAAFDSDESKIGTKIYDTPIFSIDKIPSMAQQMRITVGVLTVPAQAAQEVADLLIKGGIKAIWNFAPTYIKAPKNVVIENHQFTESLAALTRKLVEVDFRPETKL